MLYRVSIAASLLVSLVSLVTAWSVYRTHSLFLDRRVEFIYE